MRAMSRLPYVLLALLVPPAAMGACRCDEGGGAAPAGSASAASASASASVARPPVEDDDDEVKPVYPQTKDKPDPRATKYCELVHEVPEKRRKECCPSTPVTMFRPTEECSRTLSYALRSKALTLDDADLAACETAITE